MILSVLLSIAACVLGARAATLAARSAPESLRVMVESLAESVRAAEANWEVAGGKLTAWRAEMEGVLEGVEAALDSVERKRRQVAARDSRQRAAGGEASTREDYERAARTAGLV